MSKLMKVEFSTDQTKFNIFLIHSVLKDAYWSKEIPLAVVEKAIEHSFCMAAFVDDQQIGFARLITDYATFAYLADVFVVEAYQKKGVGKALVGQVIDYAEQMNLRRILLATADAHSLYAKYGFKPLAKPQNFMEIAQPDLYINLLNNKSCLNN